jgi:hypothetical protein
VEIAGIGMNKKRIAGLFALAAAGYLLWQWLTPVEIVAVHESDTLLVKHFPYLKSQRIAWWEANKELIQMKYGLPNKRSDGDYRVHIQDFGNGYVIDEKREGNGELLCFYDIPRESRCIEKAPLMKITKNDYELFYW